MKTNAPEKIYVHIKDKPCEITFSEVIEKECSNIEYIRTDAFIEKAAIWFNDYFASHDVYGVIAPFNTVEEMIEDFKKYMNR